MMIVPSVKQINCEKGSFVSPSTIACHVCLSNIMTGVQKINGAMNPQGLLRSAFIIYEYSIFIYLCQIPFHYNLHDCCYSINSQIYIFDKNSNMNNSFHSKIMYISISSKFCVHLLILTYDIYFSSLNHPRSSPSLTVLYRQFSDSLLKQTTNSLIR